MEEGLKKKRERAGIQFYDSDRESVDFRVYRRLHSYTNIQKYLKINYIVKKKIYIYYVFIVVKLTDAADASTRLSSVLVTNVIHVVTPAIAIKLLLSPRNNTRIRIEVACS